MKVNVKVKILLFLMSVWLSACATDPYFHGERPDLSAPSLSSEEYIWSRDTAQKLAYRPRGGAVISDEFEIPVIKEQGVKYVDVKTLIKRLEPK